MELYLIHPENEAYLKGEADRPVEIRSAGMLNSDIESGFGGCMMIVVLIMGAVALFQGLQQPDFVLSAVGVTFLLVGLVIGLLITRQTLKVRGFYKKGRKLKGKLLSLEIKEYEDTDGDKHIFTFVRVSFRAPDGSIVQGERYYMTDRGKLHPPPAGAAVAVFYKDDKQWEVL